MQPKTNISMKRVFLFLAFSGVLFLTSSCGSTESCRTRKSAYHVKKSQNNVVVVDNDKEIIEVR